VFLPLFIKRRLLCALRDWRQGNPPLIAHHGSRILTTGTRVVETEVGEIDPSQGTVTIGELCDAVKRIAKAFQSST